MLTSRSVGLITFLFDVNSRSVRRARFECFLVDVLLAVLGFSTTPTVFASLLLLWPRSFSIPAHVDLDTHHAIATCAVIDAMQQCFPKQDMPKNDYVPEGAWHLIRAKRAARRRMLSAPKRQQEIIDLARIMHVETEEIDDELFRFDLALHADRSTVRDVSRALRPMLRAARELFIENTIEVARVAAASNDHKRVFWCMKRLKKWAPSGVPTVTFNGKQPHDAYQTQECWAELYLEQHNGHSVDYRQMREMHPHAAVQNRVCGSEFIADVPSFIETESCLAKRTGGHAHGPDGGPPRCRPTPCKVPGARRGATLC